MEENMVNSTGAETTEQENNEAVKTYTQDEVLALLQKETDKRVTQALNTQKKKYEKKLSLSKLDDDEREKAEKDDRIAELEQLVSQMNIEKNKSELKSVLSSRGLSAEFADIVNISDDIEESQANIDKLDKLFKAAVKAEVERRIGENSNTPKGNSLASGGELTKEAFRKMSVTQQMQVYKESPELYKRLTQN